MRVPRPVPLRIAASTACAALLLVGCGSGGSDATAPDETMAGMDMAAMNEPDATPADEVDGEVTSGDFAVLPTAPPGSDGVTGTAWLAQADVGTTVTIRLEGLEPGRDYVSHLHAQTCERDDGGPHFAFDPGGSELPPNEVHLGFTADDAGAGEATVTNERRVGDRAPAIVVHPADATDNRLACADFS